MIAVLALSIRPSPEELARQEPALRGYLHRGQQPGLDQDAGRRHQGTKLQGMDLVKAHKGGGGSGP